MTDQSLTKTKRWIQAEGSTLGASKDEVGLLHASSAEFVGRVNYRLAVRGRRP